MLKFLSFILLMVLLIILLGVLFFVLIDRQSTIEHEKFQKKREGRLKKIPLNERKCSNSCKYAHDVGKYKNGNHELIGAKCTYDSIHKNDGFYVRGNGDGNFVWEKDHIGCEGYDHPFASYL